VPPIVQELRRKLWRRKHRSEPISTARRGGEKARLGYLPQTAIFASLVILTAFLFPRGKTYQFANLRVGDVYVGEDIIAPFTFPVNKSDEEYRRDVERARENVPAVFTRVDTIAVAELAAFSELLDQLNAIVGRGRVDSAKLAEAASILRRHSIVLPEESLSALPTLFKQPENVRALQDVLRGIYDTGVLDVAKDELPTRSGRISILTHGSEVADELRFYYDRGEAEAALLERLREALGNEELVKLGYQLSLPFVRPNLIYDPAETQRRIEEAVRSVPRAKGMVLERERIIESHERVTPEHLEKLRSLAEALAERQAEGGPLRAMVPYIGRLLFVALALGVFLLYLILSDKKVLAAWDKSLLAAIILLFSVAAAYLVNRTNVSGYLIPVAVSSMLLTIFFNARAGFVGTVALALIVAGMRGNEFSVSMVAVITGAVAVTAVSRVRSRSWVLNSVIRLVGAYLLSITALELLHYVSLEKLAINWAYGVTAGFLAPILTYGLAVVLEFAFDATTDMTLLELSDLNQPLLRELAVRAPGTYHHSLMVGNLAEAAAEAVGANSLLARVGAYYHDIGKMEKPEYFIENQGSGKNPHDKLSPSMSALILANHIRQGVEIAREAGLPKEIIAFIREHQGTQLMSYFYERAKENGQEAIDEQKFRYPGPKPQSKETAIVMLADAVEAAVRSLKQPTPARVKQVVNSIIQRRFNEGELDESPLTLRDLNKIADAFVQALTGVFHPRVAYPSAEEGREASEEGKKGAPKPAAERAELVSAGDAKEPSSESGAVQHDPAEGATREGTSTGARDSG